MLNEWRIRSKEIKLSIKRLQKNICKRFHVLDSFSVSIISTKNMKMKDIYMQKYTVN